MKHQRQMSLVARRAQIRRAAANRKKLPSLQPAVRPALRLVSTSDEARREQRNDLREPAAAAESSAPSNPAPRVQPIVI